MALEFTHTNLTVSSTTSTASLELLSAGRRQYIEIQNRSTIGDVWFKFVAGSSAILSTNGGAAVGDGLRLAIGETWKSTQVVEPYTQAVSARAAVISTAAAQVVDVVTIDV